MKRKKATISLEWLRAQGACGPARRLFKNIFGSHGRLTRDGLVAFALAAENTRRGAGVWWMEWLHCRLTNYHGGSRLARIRAYSLRGGSAEVRTGFYDTIAMAEAVAHCLKLK